MYGSFNFNHARGWEMTMRQKLTMCVVEFLAHFHVRVRECARTGTFLLLSCISGMFNTGRPLLEQANPVYPAVSYWAVFDTATVNAGLDIPGTVSSACGPDAQVKPIKSFRFRQDNNESRSSDTGTLFTVLKDHNSWFIYEKIIHSLFACGAADVPSREPPNAKVVVMTQSKYLRQMPESVISLNVAGLRLELEVFQGNLND